MTPPSPMPSLIPENAPFSPEQRRWLDGLFAGLLGIHENVTPSSRRRRPHALLPGSDDGADRGETRMTARHGTIRLWRCPNA